LNLIKYIQFINYEKIRPKITKIKKKGVQCA